MKNNNFYSKNLKIFKSYFPELYKKVENINEKNLLYSVLPTKKDTPTIEIIHNGKKIIIHSRIDPIKEAKRFIQSNTTGNEDIIVVFGLGLGYHIEELINRKSESKIIVIEPRIELFKLALKTRDLSKIIKSKRVSFLLNPNSLDFDNLAPHQSNIRFIIHRAYMNLAVKKALEFKHNFDSYINRKNINIATLKRFDRLWTNNTFKNAPFFFTLQGISSLKDKFKGFPAIVIGAGPSIEREIVNIKYYKKYSILIAVDTAINPLLKRGIVPDFVVTVDPQLIKSFYLVNLFINLAQERKPILVADPAVHPVTLRNYDGVKFLTSSIFSPGKIIERFSGIKGSIAAGGSVSTTAFDLSRIIGADPIILLGLDLSYKEVKTHLSGSFFERHILLNANRFNTNITQFSKYLKSGNPIRVLDKIGNTVFTDKRLLLYKSWFEDQIKYTRVKVINATKEGLHIEGIPDIPLEKAMENIKKRNTKESLKIGLVYKNMIDRYKVDNFMKYLNTIYSNLKELQNLGAKGKLIAKKLLNLNDDKLIKTFNKEFKKIDENILSYKEENLLLSMVVQSSINDVFNKSRNRDFKNAVRNSLSIYSSIEDGSKFLIKLIKLTTKKMERLLDFEENLKIVT